MVTFEALNAEYGDCILLHYAMDDESGHPQRQIILVDGGPGPTYKAALAPRLHALQAEIGVGPLKIRLGVVTHIDRDHIDGMGKLVAALSATPPPAGTPDVLFQEFWFNGFQATFGQKVAEAARGAGLASVSSTLVAQEDSETAMFLQGVAEGESLLQDMALLKARGRFPPALNAGFGSSDQQKAVGPRNIKITPDGAVKVLVLTPTKARLEALRTLWAKETGTPAQLQAVLRGEIDSSIANLSSIVFLATIKGKKILMTGDGLAEDILESWKEFQGNDTPFAIDIMKVPHHGAQGNNSVDLFKLFPAAHYVFCANGKHGNPDFNTLDKLLEARGNDAFTLHFTSLITNEKIEKQIEYLKDKISSTHPNIVLKFREKNNSSIKIEL